jgi:hypothetical protein
MQVLNYQSFPIQQSSLRIQISQQNDKSTHLQLCQVGGGIPRRCCCLRYLMGKSVLSLLSSDIIVTPYTCWETSCCGSRFAVNRDYLGKGGGGAGGIVALYYTCLPP